MMLSTWLVEICLSKCNELDDIVASESVSQDVENLRLSKTLVEEELRQILGTYKVCVFETFITLYHNKMDRRTSIQIPHTN